MKKIPTFNYIKVFILFVITIFTVLILSNNYKQKMQYERTNDDVMSFLSNVKYDELESYLVENYDGFIYMAPSTDISLESFEKSLKEYILSEELEKVFVYLDNSDYSSDMYNTLKKSFFLPSLASQVTLSNEPNVFAVKDGKIVSVLYMTPNNISLEDIQKFINANEVEND